jgi:hypothetical protein
MNNDKWERIMQEAAFAGGAEKNKKKLNQHSRSPGRDLYPGSPEYEAGVLTTRPRRSVVFVVVVVVRYSLSQHISHF